MNAPANINLITLTIPHIGEEWPGESGVFGGITGGKAGEPYFAIIVPTDSRAHFEEVELGTYGTNVTGARSNSDGLTNTKALAEAGSELCQQILQLEIDGHKDFYLMCANDAHVLAANVPHLFHEDDYYWTSTQLSPTYAFVQDFEYGYHRYDNVLISRRACAVRRIQLTN